jgi:hypothetical protein
MFNVDEKRYEELKREGRNGMSVQSQDQYHNKARQNKWQECLDSDLKLL